MPRKEDDREKRQVEQAQKARCHRPPPMSTALNLNGNDPGSLKMAVSVGFLHLQQVA
jgi:hypothetical protein